MRFPLYVTCCFSLAAFNILSWGLVLVSLISMCLGVFLLGFILYGTLVLLDLIDYFLFHVGDTFNHNLFKNFPIHFLFPFFFWDSYNSKVGVFDIVPEVSETVLTSFHSVYFSLFFRSYFHHFIFQLTELISASDILLLIPSRVFLISVIVLFVSVWLFFNSSLLIVNWFLHFLHSVFKVFDHLY